MFHTHALRMYRIWLSALLTLAVASQFPKGVIAQSAQAVPALRQNQAPAQAESATCQAPALSRLTRYRITSGDSLVAIAQRYNLIPATLLGINPSLRSGAVPVGSEIVIPPYNGIRVEVPRGQTWRDVARTYGVRADVLFEVNGCEPNPRVVFVPGVNWTPNPTPVGATQPATTILRTYPLPSPGTVLTSYGWQVASTSSEVVFHSGVDLATTPGTPVLAVGEGIVAFTGQQSNYGNLIVINHSQGLQTRYAQLDAIAVRVGQTVKAGDRIGTVGTSSDIPQPHLHFEVRSNSDLGWVAQDPGAYFRSMNRVGE